MIGSAVMPSELGRRAASRRPTGGGWPRQAASARIAGRSRFRLASASALMRWVIARCSCHRRWRRLMLSPLGLAPDAATAQVAAPLTSPARGHVVTFRRRPSDVHRLGRSQYDATPLIISRDNVSQPRLAVYAYGCRYVLIKICPTAPFRLSRPARRRNGAGLRSARPAGHLFTV